MINGARWVFFAVMPMLLFGSVANADPNCENLEQLRSTDLPRFLKCTRKQFEDWKKHMTNRENELFHDRTKRLISSVRAVDACIKQWSPLYATASHEPVSTIVEVVAGRCRRELHTYASVFSKDFTEKQTYESLIAEKKSEIARIALEARLLMQQQQEQNRLKPRDRGAWWHIKPSYGTYHREPKAASRTRIGQNTAYTIWNAA